MAYVITDACIKDRLCADVCPTDCIHPKKDEPAFEAATRTLCRPEWLHRLRTMRAGLEPDSLLYDAALLQTNDLSLNTLTH